MRTIIDMYPPTPYASQQAAATVTKGWPAHTYRIVRRGLRWFIEMLDDETGEPIGTL